MLLLLLLLSINIILISSFVPKPTKANINNIIIKATDTNRNDINDKEFKEIFRLSKSPSESTKQVLKERTAGKRWGVILTPELYYTPVSIDSAAVGWTIATQTLLINLSFLAGYIFDTQFSILTHLSLDLTSLGNRRQ